MNADYGILGHELALRVGPGSQFDRVVDRKATETAGQTKYATVDSSVTVRELCRSGKWSQVVVISPDGLADSHRGWMSSELLGPVPASAAPFVEADFLFDDKTVRYKDIIIRGVNSIHSEDSRCAMIDPTSAYISGSKGTKSNPVFFVTCGSGANAVNVFFSKSDVESGKRFASPRHVDKNLAVQACEDYAKSQATHPSTVEFSRVWNLAIQESANGNTRVSSTFTAKNAFNLETKYDPPA